MSWSTYTVTTPDEFKSRVEALKPPTPSGEVSPQVADQPTATKAAALALYESGCVGTGEAFQIQLSGHANPEHKPVQNWANDTVTVSATRVAASAVVEYDKRVAEAERNAE